MSQEAVKFKPTLYPASARFVAFGGSTLGGDPGVVALGAGHSEDRMENRFGVKDFFTFLLLVTLIVMLALAMKQYDRQWHEIRSIRAALGNQQQDLRDIHDAVNNGGLSLSNGATRPATAVDPTDDPFERIRAAQKLPGYARGDWLVDAFGNGVAKLTPMLSSDVYASDVQSFVLESLAERDPDTLEWRPLLATKGWRISDDGLHITFHLRDGLRFSDGEPLTADDVVFTYEFIMNPKIAAPRDRAYLEKLEKVVKKGPLEVEFVYKEPYFEAFQLAAGLSILPRHFYGKFAPEEFNQSVGLLMGSGPYRMEDPASWKPGTLIQLVRNERYWGVQPAFDRMVFREITNDTAHLIAFRNGDIDQFGASPEQYRQLLKDDALVARTQHFEYMSPLGGYRYLAWNQIRDGKPTRFADKRVRQALTMLLDRQRMIQEVALGYAVQATGPFSPASKQSNPDVKPWPYDVDRATRLLADAGYTKKNDAGVLLGPDGKPFEFRLTYPSGSGNYEKMVLYLKDAYARVGIVLDPDPLEWASFTDRLNNKNFEAISLGWSAGIESDIYQMFDSSQIIAGGDDFVNYKNEELDKAIEKARSTVKEEDRMPLWRRAHAILHEDQPYTFLWFGKSLRFIDGRIKNVHVTKLGLDPSVVPTWYVSRGEQKWTK